MNPIVLVLRRPLTVTVLVVGVALGSILAVTRMSIGNIFSAPLKLQ